MYIKDFTDLTPANFKNILQEFTSENAKLEIFPFPVQNAFYIEFGLEKKENKYIFFSSLDSTKYKIYESNIYKHSSHSFSNIYENIHNILKSTFDKILVSNEFNELIKNYKFGKNQNIVYKAYFTINNLYLSEYQQVKNLKYNLFILSFNTKLIYSNFKDWVELLGNQFVNSNVNIINRNILFSGSYKLLKNKLSFLTNFLEKRLERFTQLYKTDKIGNFEKLIKIQNYTNKVIQKYLNSCKLIFYKQYDDYIYQSIIIVNSRGKIIRVLHPEYQNFIYTNYYYNLKSNGENVIFSANSGYIDSKKYWNKLKEFNLKFNTEYSDNKEVKSIKKLFLQIGIEFYGGHPILFDEHLFNMVIFNYLAYKKYTLSQLKANTHLLSNIIISFIKETYPDTKILEDTEIKYITLQKWTNQTLKYINQTEPPDFEDLTLTKRFTAFLKLLNFIKNIKSNLLSDIYIVMFLLYDKI